MILLDIDGVCMNMLDAIRDRNENFIPSNVLSYDFSEGNYGITREEVFQMLEEAETFELQRMYKGTLNGIAKLRDVDSVVGFTSVPKDCARIRRKQLCRLGIYGMIFDGDKAIQDGAFAIIEDNPSELDKYINTPTVCIIMDRPYNRCYNKGNVKRVKSLDEAASYLFSLKNSK